MRLYPPVKVIPQSYKGVKVCVVPNQSMTLREIIKRFLRKESLPIEKNGIYSEDHGDIEKLAKRDIVEIHESGMALRNKFKAWEKLKQQELEEAEALAKKAVESPPSPAQPPQGVVTGAGVGGQAPPP